MTDTEKPAQAADETRNLGRGAIYLTATKFWFMVSGYIVYFALPRLLGEGEVGVARFGDYKVVTGFIAIFNALAVQGTTQAVSRFVGKNPETGHGVRRAAYKLQAYVGGGLFIFLFGTAHLVAEHVYHDPALTNPIRYASFITLFYSFYAVSVGYMNGTKSFKQQALVDFSYSTAKVVGIITAALLLRDSLGFVEAPVIGFSLSAGFVCLLAYILIGRAHGPGQQDLGELLKFQGLTMAFSGLATAVAQGDLLVLKAVVGSSSTLTGHYGAAQAFATIPFQAVFAITFVLFPLVSGAAGRDDQKIREYVKQTTRYAAMIAAMIVCLFISCPERTITILFKPEYRPAAAALRFLVAGYFFYSIFFIMCAVITASGRAKKSVMLVGTTALVQYFSCWMLAGPLGLGMKGAAIGTGLAMFVGVGLANRTLQNTFGQGVVLSKIVRIVGVAVVVGAANHALFARETLWAGQGILANIGYTDGVGGLTAKLVTLVGFGGMSLIYIALLMITGIIDGDDKAKFGRVFKRG